jgi:AraC-like DNA-binding protein
VYPEVIDRLTPAVDGLSATLDAMRVRSVVYCRSELGAPWGFGVAASPQPKFHLVLSGPARLTLDNGDEATLQAGDLVLLPHGTGHTMRDTPTSRTRDLDVILKDHPLDATGRMHYGGCGPKTSLVCGSFDVASAVELLGWLPLMIVLDAANNGLGRWLDPMVDLLRSDGDALPGEAAVVAKVADAFLTDVLRHYLTTSESQLRLNPAIIEEDPAVADVIALIHTRSGDPWTVEALACHVGMSRSSLVSRFSKAVGVAPVAYLTRLRLARASGSLATSAQPLIEVARAAGYGNESSFSKAFARHYGQPPGQYRREHRAR